jgi:hypothetical protein
LGGNEFIYGLAAPECADRVDVGCFGCLDIGGMIADHDGILGDDAEFLEGEVDSGGVGFGLAHVLAGDEVIDRPVVVGDESIAECFAAGGDDGDRNIVGFEGLQ